MTYQDQYLTIGNTKYRFVCYETRDGYQIVDVFHMEGNPLYPIYRYDRKNNYPWCACWEDAGNELVASELSRVWDARAR